MAVMSAGITARLVDRFGPKPVMYPALVLAAAGLILFASAGEHASYFPDIFFAFLLLGLGAGASFMPLLQIAMSEIPTADAGLGSGVVNVSQQLAGAVGLAVLSTIATSRTRSLVASGHALVHSLTLGYQLALYIAAGCVLAGLALAPILLRTSESPEEEKAHIDENMQSPETREHLVI
jgi:MFS family permease